MALKSDDGAPEWLEYMRAITGLTEDPSGDNPKILGMARIIGRVYPEMKSYCDQYQHDSTAWCGLTAAFCCTVAGYRPPFGEEDTDCFLWAQSFASDPNFEEIGTPRLGSVVVMTREGGGHVTLWEGETDGSVTCRGGNQSDMVNVANYAKSSVIGYYWPKGAALPPAPRRELMKGDTGDDVAALQRSLGLPDDGDFGSVTDSGVKAFQGAVGLAKDGVVGDQTWAAIDELDQRMAEGDDGISDQLAEAIDRLVADCSPVQAITWPDRGKPPPGYYNGLAKTFALAVARYSGGDAAMGIMAEAAGDPDEDALAYYKTEFKNEDMNNDTAGLDTLRHLFVLMFGLGMRESSGNCWEGRDMSASNVQSDTCEAGLFQTSWNASNCVDGEIDELLEEYTIDPNGFGPTFRRGLSPNASQLDCYGSGDGATYQWLARFSPAFAALMTGVGLRRLKDHWGPIIRREVDIMPQIDDMLIEVQRLMDTEPVPPEPEAATVTISVKTQGDVTVAVEESEGPPADPAKVTIGVQSEGDVVVDVQENVPGRRGRRFT